ncbi:MAG: hypothetical protein C0404_12475, partial [Verrucomicrobia bacterium]|nr:hypothetical protein [Verrucomicrobiota bacterium]
RSSAHLVLSLIWLVGLAYNVTLLLSGHNQWLLIFRAAHVVALITATIFALVVQAGSTLSRELKNLTWISAVYLSISIFLVCCHVMYAIIAGAEEGDFAFGTIFTSTFGVCRSLADAFCSACFAFLSYSFMLRFMKLRRQPPAVDASTHPLSPEEPRGEVNDFASELPSPHEDPPAAEPAQPEDTSRTQ